MNLRLTKAFYGRVSQLKGYCNCLRRHERDGHVEKITSTSV
jgi:hypothetical protein